MPRRTSSRPPGSPALPPLRPWLARLLGALLALWVAELLFANFVLGTPSDLYAVLAWWPGFDVRLLWQPFTRLLVQGNNLFGVVIDLLMLYFFLPWTVDRFTPRQLLTGAAAVLGGCIVAGLTWYGIATLAGELGVPASPRWLSMPAMGWHPFVVGMIVAFALAIPNERINLFFVANVPARVVLWITVAFAVLGFLVQPGLPSFERFGAIGAVVAWFHLVGPGATRRRFKSAGRRIERELKFTVHEGGRSREKRGGRSDDAWH
jgi:hypothetical protein